MVLLDAHRISTVKLFNVSNMFLNDLSVTFIPTEVLKHSRKDKHPDKFVYTWYTDKKLCIMSCLREYPTRREKYVGLNTDQLIITLKKPFKGEWIDTMRRWTKDIFILNNIGDFFPIAAGQPQRVKLRTWRLTLMKCSNEVVSKIRKTFSSIMIKSKLNMLQMT